jgi:hypothetical protein
LTAPAAQRLGSAVLLQGSALYEVRYVLTVGARERARRDGVPVSAGVREVLARINEAIVEEQMSAGGHTKGQVRRLRGHADLADGSDGAEWHMPDSFRAISSEEVAERLGIGSRQVRRLASSLGAHRAPSGAWMYDPVAVDTYAALRRLERAPDAGSDARRTAR